ncbi:MAG TPA: TRAP transporter small permease [Candidatus Competibacteraceae bacterium]|nr:TRAP transporter small permease [Candidatus Competibacteraceae bacterium]
MRNVLDALYRLGGALAALFLVAIAVVVLAQVGANLIGALSGWLTGERLGLVVPSYAEFAGYFLAASSFLGLAYTLRLGGHIRVNLVLGRLPAGVRRRLELWCCAAALAMAGYFTFYLGNLAWESWSFGDVSTGMVPVPLWIPQAVMTLGLGLLCIALLDEAVTLARGGEPDYLRHEQGSE